MDAGLIVLVLLLGGLFGVALFAARHARRERDRLDAESVLGEGEVLAVWQDGTAIRVRYRFLPAGAAEPVVRSELAHCLRVMVPEPGEKVRVRYDPRDPKRRARMLPPG